MPSFDISCTFFAAAIFLGLAPGPDNIFVLTQSSLFGMKAGFVTTLGLVSGLCFHTLAVALGVAILFKTSPVAFNLLKCAGAAYLCWLAWLSFRAGADITKEGSQTFPGYSALYRRGIIMNITNPKVLLFFLAFLPQFCNPALGSIGLQTIWFGFLFILATIIVFFTVAALGDRLASRLRNSPRAQIIMHKITGCIFLGLAIALAFAEQ